MGIYMSNIAKTDSQAKVHYNPSKADWMTGHADITGLAVVEVERLWIRFKQLSPDKNGNIPQKTLDKGEFSQDVFIKNIISNLPRERDGSLSFMVFIRLLQWLENSPSDEKLKIIYNFLNNGKDLDATIISKVLKRVYNNNISDEELGTVTDIFMNQLDERKTGRINEDQFVYNVKRIVAPNQLKEFLKFEIIPSDLIDEAHMEPSISGSMISLRNLDETAPLDDQITDQQMELIASKISKKNWEKLMITKLGFLEEDVQAYKNDYKGNTNTVIVEMLKQWRDVDPQLATPNRLKRYLEDCNMLDASIVLD